MSLDLESQSLFQLESYQAPGADLFRHSLDSLSLASMFRYDGLVRDLILEFKIRTHWPSGRVLIETFTSDPRVLEYVSGADVIMPVPSSLWSRVRGKYDLAYALAEGLSSKSHIPLVPPPWSMSFSTKKQSFRSYDDRVTIQKRSAFFSGLSGIFKINSQLNRATKRKATERPLIVLVDDIVTSGRTLLKLSESVPSARCRLLTLATAFRERPGRTKDEPDLNS